MFDGIDLPAPVRLLMSARGYIEKGWCQCAVAINAAGAPVSETSDEAVEWCALGALSRAAGDGGEDYRDARLMLGHVVGQRIARWNDAKRRTKAQVLKAFDRAIAILMP